ncbi:phosphatase PAP2 family protein [Flavobacterium luteum]|uniref:Phosphatase PAP2 family protein n=1 Tax=Flavobacterium luteum TaxID=2026654 RepID=A0A7J5AKW5_9FLAO|nr:phosphatase PAP2 family protein [Flavobacterium luteum]
MATNAQNSNTLDTITNYKSNPLRFNYKQILIPSSLIGFGLFGLNSNKIKNLNIDNRNEFIENIDEKASIDDFLQYTPAVSVYALNTLGISGKHNFKDRTVILGTSFLLVLTSVKILKNNTKVRRPDNSNDKSFPSGHTATAFAGAEFLYQEFKDKSIWYGVSGYLVATTTGIFRMYNNKHWLTDVLAGAGFGILSTKAACWLSPFLNKHILPSLSGNTTAFLTPTYDGNQIGGAFVLTF